MFSASLGSFGRESDPAVLNVKPRRLTIVELNRSLTFEDLLRDYPSTVDRQTVAFINSLQPSASLAAGDQFKRVVGGPAR